MSVHIRSFLPGDESAFRQLNEEWISHYFVLEQADRDALNDPQTAILASGGEIFFALLAGRTLGCCALVPHAGAWEVAKMAVSPDARGHGIGRLLLAHTIASARTRGIARLYLESNRILTPALRLYESLGFQHLPPERIAPSPYSRANVFMELLLGPQALNGS